MAESDPATEAFAALRHVLDGYEDLLSVARDLAERTFRAGELKAEEIELYRQQFETVGVQIGYLRAMMEMGVPPKSC